MERELIMKRLLILTCVISLALIVPASAAVREGNKEIAVFGLVTANGDTEVTAGGSFGYFVTNEIEIAGALFGQWQEGPDSYTAAAQAKYHFLTNSTTVPYIGAFGGGLFDGDTVWVYGPLGGVKLFVNETTSIFAEYRYVMISESGYEDTHEGVIGISFLLP